MKRLDCCLRVLCFHRSSQVDKLLMPVERCSSSSTKYELEALTVVRATTHIRAYSYGHPCDVFTDDVYKLC